MFKNYFISLVILLCTSLAVHSQQSFLTQTQPEKIILVFGADWCGYCTRMHEDSWPEVQDIIEEDYAGIYFCDTDEESELANSWSVHTLPTVIIAIPSGNGNATTVKRHSGYMGPDELRRWLSE